MTLALSGHVLAEAFGVLGGDMAPVTYDRPREVLFSGGRTLSHSQSDGRLTDIMRPDKTLCHEEAGRRIHPWLQPILRL